MSAKDRSIAGVQLRRHPDGSFDAETADRVMYVDPREDAEDNFAGELVSVLNALWTAAGAVQAPAVQDEREALRAAQAAAVMPLIGPLLDAWESADHDALEDQAELVKQMEAINFAMEHAGDESDVPVQGSQP